MQAMFVSPFLPFLVFEVQEAIVSFSQFMKSGFGCEMNIDDMHLTLGKTKIPLHQEGRHFYLRPARLVSDVPPDQHIVTSVRHRTEPMKLATLGCRAMHENADRWDMYREEGVLRRVHERSRKHVSPLGCNKSWD